MRQDGQKVTPLFLIKKSDLLYYHLCTLKYSLNIQVFNKKGSKRFLQFKSGTSQRFEESVHIHYCVLIIPRISNVAKLKDSFLLLSAIRSERQVCKFQRNSEHYMAQIIFHRLSPEERTVIDYIKDDFSFRRQKRQLA